MKMSKWIDIELIVVLISIICIFWGWYSEKFFISAAWSFAGGSALTRWHMNNFESDE